MMKRIITIVLVVALVATVAVAAIPSWRNTVMNWISGETQVDGSIDSTNPTDSTDPTESTTPTDETQGTEPTDPTEGEDVSEPEEITGMDLTFEQLWELIHTPEGDIRIAQGVVIADVTYEGGNLKEETPEEQEQLFAGVTNTDHGVFSVWNEMFTVERKPGVGVSDELHLSLCDNTKCGHKAHLYENWSVNNLTAAEGNEALSPESWTYMEGQPTEVLLSYEEREIIRAAACTWTVVNESGEVVRYYGLRVCGVPEDPEPPVKEDPVNEFEVSFKFVAANGATLPNGVLSQRPASVKVAEGETYKVNFTFKSVETEAGTWTFKSWDKTSFKVTGNVTVTGTWVFTEKPGEGGEPEKETYTVTYEFVSKTGEALPSAVTSLRPAAKTVEEGTKVTSPSIQSTVKVSGGTWTFNGWDKKEVTVNANVTVTGSWSFKADEQPPVVKEYTVSYKFVGTNGTLPQEVMSMLPASVVVKEGTIVTPKNLTGVEVEVSNGTWKFQGWDKSSANVSSDTIFTGTWKFVEKLSLEDPIEDYTITFKFTATNGTLPSAVKNLRPSAIVAQKGETVTAPSIKPIVEVDGGKWVFNGWSSNSITVVGDATITGSWTFEKDPEPEHSQPEGDEDPNPVAENQDELDELGERTDEVPEEDNTPEHSDREELSLMPVGEEGSDNNEQPDEEGINNQHTPVDDVARSEVNAEEEKTQSDNELSLIPVEEDVDSTDDVEEGESGLTLADPVDDSVVADDATQNELDSMFPGRE